LAQSPASQPNQPQGQSEPYLSANQQKGEFPTSIELNCSGCHGAGKTLPNLGGDQFHKDAHGAMTASIHAKLVNGKPAAGCVDCHTRGGDMRSILPAENPQSTVNRANMAQTCGRCHNEAAQTFHYSIHGSLRDAGAQKPASCADCHGSHSIEPASDLRSQVNRTNTAEQVCIKCHSDKVSDYENSSHGMALKHGSENAPTCTTCHTAVSHLPAPLSLRDFNMQMVNNCSKCHEKQAPSYRDTFHGQATALNFKLAATCADCHTPHKNLPASNAASSVNPQNLVQTCARCHAGANANFATYSPHPEPDNPEKSALVYYVAGFMEWLLIGVFSFFGIHTLLWLQRSIVAFVREKPAHSSDDEQYVTRFAPIHRFTHVLIVVSFIILAATGLPLMFYYTGWGQTLMSLFGGVTVARFLHRVCAVITFGYAAIHLIFVVKKAIIERKWTILYGPDSMMIRPQDFKDAFNMIRWFLYLGPRPKLDRWTYWEKFDYFAVFWGVPVIGFSGLMLWFPTFFTSFLPGVALNLAMIIHGEEALLATAFIFAFHFFHNHLRPENFPMDIVIFTGKMTMSKFKDERPVEYQRLLDEGKLESVITDPPSKRQRLIAKTFGFAAYISGLIMVISIFATLLIYKL
jgi:cytochrome b subunit of formate dehydrogenase/nitrate/TMAO reductase-like tetraheme cytochrome c subunit